VVVAHERDFVRSLGADADLLQCAVVNGVAPDGNGVVNELHYFFVMVVVDFLNADDADLSGLKRIFREENLSFFKVPDFLKSLIS
jgi:hypothetical protein